MHLQEVVAHITAEDGGLQESIIGQLDVEATAHVNVGIETEDQIDKEDDTNAQAGVVKANGRIGGEEVHGDGGGGTGVETEEDVGLELVEIQAEGRVQQILPQLGRDAALGLAVDAGDIQADRLGRAGIVLVPGEVTSPQTNKLSATIQPSNDRHRVK